MPIGNKRIFGVIGHRLIYHIANYNYSNLTTSICPLSKPSGQEENPRFKRILAIHREEHYIGTNDIDI